MRCFGTSRCDAGAQSCGQFLYAHRREVLRNLRCEQPGLEVVHGVFLYALRREVLRNLSKGNENMNHLEFLYALRREVLRNVGTGAASAADRRRVSIRPSA